MTPAVYDVPDAGRDVLFLDGQTDRGLETLQHAELGVGNGERPDESDRDQRDNVGEARDCDSARPKVLPVAGSHSRVSDERYRDERRERDQRHRGQPVEYRGVQARGSPARTDVIVEEPYDVQDDATDEHPDVRRKSSVVFAFVKTARAKGASVWRVGLHVFRNAAVPLLTLFFTDMFGMVVVGMFVIEFVTGVPGFADMAIHAVSDGNLPLLLAVVTLSVLVGVVANFAQDVAYAVFDPRVRYGE